MRDQSHISPDRVRRQNMSQWNPIATLTPTTLTAQFNEWTGGTFSRIGRTFEAIANRDDILKSVIPKRKDSVRRRSYEILTVDGANPAEAEKHKNCLQYFYSNLEAGSAVNGNLRGGFSTLVGQMMDAIGMRYAVHELIFKPTPEGLTAKFNFVPLYFFENHTGTLRFLPEEGAYEGNPLEEGGWMVTCAPDGGLMEASAAAYMYKRLSLSDWLAACERGGMPAFVGKTDSPIGSEAREKLEEIVAALAAECAAVISKEDEIEVTSLGASGEMPYPKLVEKMDRALVTIWRGGDLGTMSSGSSGQGMGASLQDEERIMQEASDCGMISETLQHNIDKLAIAWEFGPGTKPLAYIKVIVPSEVNVDKEIKINEHLVKYGVPVGVKDVQERLQVQVPDEGEELLKAPVVTTPAGGAGAKPELPAEPDTAANIAGIDMNPLFTSLDRVLDMTGEEAKVESAKIQQALNTLSANTFNPDQERASDGKWTSEGGMHTTMAYWPKKSVAESASARAKLVADGEKKISEELAKSEPTIHHEEGNEDQLESWEISPPPKNDNPLSASVSHDGTKYIVYDEQGSERWGDGDVDLKKALNNAKDYVRSGGSTDAYIEKSNYRTQILGTLNLPDGFELKSLQDTKYGSVYYGVEHVVARDADGDPTETKKYKVSIRNHDPSPFREKEFGANDYWIEVPKEADLESLSKAVGDVEQYFQRRANPKAK